MTKPNPSLQPRPGTEGYQPPKVTFAQPRQIANSASYELHVPGQWWTRPNSCTKHIKSRGF